MITQCLKVCVYVCVCVCSHRPGVLKEPKIMAGVWLFIFYFTCLILARQVRGRVCLCSYVRACLLSACVRACVVHAFLLVCVYLLYTCVFKLCVFKVFVCVNDVCSRQDELGCRVEFLLQQCFRTERDEMETMANVNKLLLKNVLPLHVASEFMGKTIRNQVSKLVCVSVRPGFKYCLQ